MSTAFSRLARIVAAATGHWAGFAAACLVVIVWAVSGPFLGYNETWMLVINTLTTIVTFLMVFLLQHTQMANEKAMQTKLDELITKLPEPDDAVAGIENEDDDDDDEDEGIWSLRKGPPPDETRTEVGRSYDPWRDNAVAGIEQEER